MNETIRAAREIITGYSGRPLRIMEVCGTHTHEIFRLGIRGLLPESIDLISGPGCPVCVTAVGFIDEACWLALEQGCIVCTFGDLIRVPGTEMSLAGARAKGADVRPVYSPLDAVEIAKENPDRQVAFLAVGFETTTPSACLAAKQAKAAGLKNFSLLTANKTMPNAYQALVGSADAFLYPGHVNAITGNAVCQRLCEEQGVSGENMARSKEEIENIADTLVQGYARQLDRLYRAEAVDIAGDVSVIENMMRRDGLTGSKDFSFRKATDEYMRDMKRKEAEKAYAEAEAAAAPAETPAETPAVQTAGEGQVMGGH